MNPTESPLVIEYPNLKPLLASSFGGAPEFPSIPWFTQNAFLDFIHILVEVRHSLNLGVGSYQLKNKLDPKYRTESVMYTGQVDRLEVEESLEMPYSVIWAQESEVREVVEITRDVFMPAEAVEGSPRKEGFVRIEFQRDFYLTPSEQAIFLGLALKSYERALNNSFAITDVREDNLFGQSMKNFLCIVAQNHIKAYY